jgi:uncharacterized membrane protein
MYAEARQDKQHGQARTTMVKHPKHLMAGRDFRLVAYHMYLFGGCTCFLPLISYNLKSLGFSPR